MFICPFRETLTFIEVGMVRNLTRLTQNIRFQNVAISEIVLNILKIILNLLKIQYFWLHTHLIHHHDHFDRCEKTPFLKLAYHN